MDLHSDFATININTIILVVSVSVFACFMWYFSTKLNTHLKGLESSKESQILFDMCLNAGKIGTWQYDIKHDILLWSQEMVDLFGIDVKNLQGFLDTVHPEDVERIKNACNKTIETHVKYAQNYRIVMPNGDIKMIAAKGEVYKDKFLGIASDITDLEASKLELIRKTEQLEDSNKELSKFAYVTSHDLKAPLRAVTNLIGWILEEVNVIVPEPSADLVKYIGLIKNRVKKMELLIDGILEYSRVGRCNIEKETLDLNQTVKEVVELVGKEGYTIHVDKLPSIWGNSVRVSQIFTNLINNAIQHHDKPTGNVWVKYEELPNFHKFCIVDDGPGIDPKYHKKIFEMFQTLGSKENTESTGIGLPIVKKILEHKGGSIDVLSELGKGASFCFKIPKKDKFIK